MVSIGRGVRRRAVQLVISLVGLSTVLFVLLHLSGNPAYTVAGPNASQATIHAIEVELGLTKPLVVQYLIFMEHMVSFRFGDSTVTQTSANALVWAHLPYTLELAACGMVIGLVVAVPTGVWLAMRDGRLMARGVHLVAKAGQSVPGFVVGLILILVFSEHLRLFPVVGATGPSSIVLPSVALASYLAPKLIRLTRSAARDVLTQEHVLTARAKGLTDLHIGMHYVMRNCLVTVTALAALQLAQLISGAVIIETVFAWPGVGSLMVSSVINSDFSVVEAAVVYIAILISLVNAIVDSVLPLMDPRLRATR